MMNLFERGRELGYSHADVKRMLRRERMMKQVLDCESLEDTKILLIHWMEEGKI